MLLQLSAAEAAASGESIKVIYPKPGQTIGAVDSTFILGHLTVDNPAEYDLTVNDQPVAVHEDGGFLAFLAIASGEFTFYLKARSVIDVASERADDGALSTHLDPGILTLNLSVSVPRPGMPVGIDSLVIVDEYDRPSGDLALATGDVLRTSFLGTPGCRAWFSIGDVIDSVAMAETGQQFQPYWGKAVFGRGAVPDSLKLKGVYAGFLSVADSLVTSQDTIRFHLAAPDKAEIVCRYLLPPYELMDSVALKYLHLPDTAVSVRSTYSVSLNDHAYPFTVRFTDSVQIVRLGPRKGYLSIFQPEGVQALAVGAEGDWYRVRLSATRFGWVNKNSVKRLPKGILPPRSYVTSIRTYDEPDRLRVEVGLKGQHPFRVIEETRRRVRIRLYGVTSDTDWIRYDEASDLIDLVTWSQIENDLYELTLNLTESIWGYDAYYEGNSFYFQLNKPPSSTSKIKGKRIVIDAGHSSDPGSIGPTGYTEAEANLAIALALEKYLQSKGAQVVMTRSDTSDVPLYDRPAIANLHDADLFVSIHNNALPDGVNPFVNNGTSAYYYHPHSIDLARSIHAEMVKHTGLSDHGLFHGNLAVNRPTQYPAVLIECAFMIIPEQEALLKTDRFRDRVARAIGKGIENFLKEYDSGRR
ncbi:MAG: N-acetylmuramoyl-L-alanine amidase [Candidatus Zixiibacteriota bacterium]